jgi:hypothetical protein
VSGSSTTGNRNRAAFGQLVGSVLVSETNPRVSYRVERVIGRGGFASHASRRVKASATPVQSC